MQITYVPRQSIYPAFGMYYYRSDIAKIRDDLPKSAEAFVIEHERGHSVGKGEIMATLSAIPKHPIGFIIIAFMSLAPYRIKYYWQRITGKNP